MASYICLLCPLTMASHIDIINSRVKQRPPRGGDKVTIKIELNLKFKKIVITIKK